MSRRTTMMALGMFNGAKTVKKSDPLQGVDLKSEYDLIKQKKSTLPVSKRSLVVYRWEKVLNGSGQ